MKYFKKPIWLVLCIAIINSQCTNKKTIQTSEKKKPLKIILMIGDGMGLAQICAASVVNDGLYLELLKAIGFIKTSSADDYITDSAAGATAFSTGEKTYNNAIGVGLDTLKRKTILEMAEEAGLSTGLISTCSVTHATPASFFAHQKHRKMHQEIANDFYGKGIDYVAATGKPYFDLNKLKNDGYHVQVGGNFLSEKGSKNFWFYNDSIHPPKANVRGNWLQDATKNGIELLNQNKQGFFMMIEGSQIDWGGHDNDLDYVVNELIDFDKAIKEAVEFAKKDGNTLVIITADHETGGLSLNEGDLKNKKVMGHFSSKEHSGIMVPVFSFGPGSEHFTGTMQNTDIFKKMKMLYGF